MNKPFFKEEKKLWKKGYKRIAGLDEAGRGPLAGPVVAAAVTFFRIQNTKYKIPKIKDSKKLTSIQREKFYKILTNHPQIKWGIGRVSEKVIDRINILEATKLAMEKAVKNLEKKIKKADFLILDGNFKINSSTLRHTQGGERSRTIPQKSIIKADDKVFSLVLGNDRHAFEK